MSLNKQRIRNRVLTLVLSFVASILAGAYLFGVYQKRSRQLPSQTVAALETLLKTPIRANSHAGLSLSSSEEVPFVGPPYLDELSYPHSVTLGRADRGALQNPAKLKESRYFTVREGHNYGTEELVSALQNAGKAVHEEHPASPRLHVGDLSLKDGGPFPPHWSHQSGCDVDLGYYLKQGHDDTTMGLATRRRLDAPRTWTFLESLLMRGQVEYIFSDRSLIPILLKEAKARDIYTQQELNAWFGSGHGLIRHLDGHRDHLHIRIRPSKSVEAQTQFVAHHGRYAIRRLLDRRPVFANVGLNDNWSTLANRYGVGIKRLKRFNGLPEDFILPDAGTRVIVGFQSPKHGYRSANPRLTGRSQSDI